MKNEKKITNIVKFSVNDVVGSTTTTRTQAAVFYDDGTVEILPIEDAIELSKNEKVMMKQTTPDKLEKNFQSYFTATPKKKKKKTTSKEKTTLFQKIKNGLNKVKDFILKPFRLFYENVVVRGCEYATLHILQRDKLKKAAEEETKESKEGQEEKKGFFSNFKKGKEKKKEKGEKKGFFSKRKEAKAKKKNKKKSTKKRKRMSTAIKAAIAAIVITVGGALGISSCMKNSSQVDSNSKVESTSNDLDNLTKNEIINLIKEYKLTPDQVATLVEDGKISNDDLSGLSYEQLLYITTD